MDNNILNDNKSDNDDDDDYLQHEGIIFNPEIRQIPDDICQQIGLAAGAGVRKECGPCEYDRTPRYVIPNQFWKIAGAPPQFNGLTCEDVSDLLLLEYHQPCVRLLNHLEKNASPWDELRKLFVQTHPDEKYCICLGKDNALPLLYWLRLKLTACLTAFYNLCSERELPTIHVTDVGHRVGYAYIVIVHIDVHRRDDISDYTVCITTDLSHAKKVAEYLCKAFSLLRRNVDVEFPKDFYIDIDDIQAIYSVSIDRMPVMSGGDMNHDDLVGPIDFVARSDHHVCTTDDLDGQNNSQYVSPLQSKCSLVDDVE
jgi:hypothetical protein